MRRIEQILLLLLIASIPIQLGYHFWPQSAFVSGIRIDYLSPIFYLTDIFLLSIVGIFSLQIVRGNVVPKNFPILILGLTLLCIPSVFLAKELGSLIYSILRILAYIIFGFCVSRSVDRALLKKIANIFMGVSIIVVLLVLVQFINQGSIQGIFYWLGERNFSLSTPGIARFSLDDRLILRPYATFPHPNVLAFYLFTSLVFVRYLIVKSPNRMRKIIEVIVYLFIFLGLLLTFSRVLIVLALILLFLDILRKKILIVMFAVLVGLVLLVIGDRFSLETLAEDFVERYEHSQRLGSFLGEKIVFGVGLNQYFYHQIEIERQISPYFLQPPHSAPFLVLVQTGIGGLVFVLWGIYKTLKNVINSPFTPEKELKVILLATLLFASFFDHYFITLHQGMLLTALVFGLAWANNQGAGVGLGSGRGQVTQY